MTFIVTGSQSGEGFTGSVLSEVDRTRVGGNRDRDLASLLHQEREPNTQNITETNDQHDQDAVDHLVSLGAPPERGARERPHVGRSANAASAQLLEQGAAISDGVKSLVSAIAEKDVRSIQVKNTNRVFGMKLVLRNKLQVIKDVLEYMKDRSKPEDITNLLTQYNGAPYPSIATHVSHLADTDSVVMVEIGAEDNEKYILFK